MSKFAYVAAVMLVLPAPALAQIAFNNSPAAQTPVKADKNKSDLDKVECRSQETLGSRLERHQICLTKQQWMTNEQEAKLKVHEMQDTGLVSH